MGGPRRAHLLQPVPGREVGPDVDGPTDEHRRVHRGELGVDVEEREVGEVHVGV